MAIDDDSMRPGEEAVARVNTRIQWLYGVDVLPRPAGVLHVTAVWEDASGVLHTIVIDDHSPRSATDFFALQLARARADVVVATGKLLRDEPGLSHDFVGDDGTDLREWRRAHGDGARPPRAIVLTSGRGLPVDHPLWSAEPGPGIVTGQDPAPAIEVLERRGIAVARLAAPSLVAAIAWSREALGARSVCVEAGATTTAALYRGGPGVDELCISLFHGTLRPDRLAAPLGRRQDLFSAYPRCLPARIVDEPSGRWSFQRRWR